MAKEKETLYIHYKRNNVSLSLDVNKKEFFSNVSNEDVVRYLKGIFTNKERFNSRFIQLFRDIKTKTVDFDPTIDLNIFECDDFMDELLDIYDRVEPFTYVEGFKIEDQEFQALVFGSIDITEMIKELGHERIATEGKRVSHKQFSPSGEYEGMVEYDNIYEVHRVNGEKLGLEESVYALKCWCTTTDKEHWLWIEDEYKDDPLAAVASTFRLHSNLIPHITEIKRQGDVLLVELDEELEPEGEIVPLTKEQYFGFLTAQS